MSETDLDALNALWGQIVNGVLAGLCFAIALNLMGILVLRSLERNAVDSALRRRRIEGSMKRGVEQPDDGPVEP